MSEDLPSTSGPPALRSLANASPVRFALMVFALLFASYAAFASGLYNWNTLSRIGLTLNFVQYGRLDIDGYDKLTHDKAFFEGHYYSDKAPGISFLAMPIAYAYTRVAPVVANVLYVERWSKAPMQTEDGLIEPPGAGTPQADLINADAAGRKLSLMIYLCTLLTVGLVTALAGAVLFSYVAQQTRSAAAGLVAALAYGLATPTWEWATSFFGHAPAGALLIIGFVLLERLARERAWNKRKVALTLLAGAALGAAITVEFTAAIAAAILIVYYSAQGFASKRKSCAIALDVVAICATIGLMQIPLLIYNNAIFGSPFHLGYSNVVGFNGMKSGFFGISAPNPVALCQILFSFYRGVVWLSPVLVFAAVAVCKGLKRGDERLRAAAILGLSLIYLALNAGYVYWDGGDSTGPRHITPIYPFLTLALGLWYARAARSWRIATLATLGVSMFVSLACVGVETMAPTDIKAPLTDAILPSFFRGDLPQSMVQIVLHRQGLWQLAPIAAVWLGLGYLLRRDLKRLPSQP